MTKTLIGSLLHKASNSIQRSFSQDPTVFLGIPRKILAYHLHVDPSHFLIHAQQEVTPPVASLFARDLDLFLQGVPLSRIWGEKEFWSLPFQLSEATLDPRPETEHVVEVALSHLTLSSPSPHPPFFLDLGTGSGCILLSLLHEVKNAHGLGVDLSWEALKTAQLNGHQLGLSQRVKWVQGFWGTFLKGPFSLIVSNPPYISAPDMPLLPDVVSTFDPRLALYGGSDGLEAYRTILSSTLQLLCSQGALVVEIGHTQGKEVADLFTYHRFEEVHIHQDLANKDRVVSGRRP